MEKSGIIDDLKERLNKLEKHLNEKNEPVVKKKKSGVDEEVCPVCGEDLQFVEEGIVYCPKCKEYFEYEEDEE